MNAQTHIDPDTYDRFKGVYNGVLFSLPFWVAIGLALEYF